jgi:hypothetical protein
LARVTAGGAAPHLREAPVLVERMWVRLDVLAPSLVACAIDGEVGEIQALRISPKIE